MAAQLVIYGKLARYYVDDNLTLLCRLATPFGDNEPRYNWSFATNTSIKAVDLLADNGYFEKTNISLTDNGNYTCAVTAGSWNTSITIYIPVRLQNDQDTPAEGAAAFVTVVHRGSSIIVIPIACGAFILLLATLSIVYIIVQKGKGINNDLD